MTLYFVEWRLTTGANFGSKPMSGVEPLVEGTDPQDVRQRWPAVAAAKLKASASDIAISKVVKMTPDEIERCKLRRGAVYGAGSQRQPASTSAQIIRANALLREQRAR